MTIQRRERKRPNNGGASKTPASKPGVRDEGWQLLQGSIGNAAVGRLLEGRNEARVEGTTPISADTQARIDAQRGAGSELDPGLREEMTETLGVEVPEAKLHRGPEADGLAHDLHAHAFTQGSDVFLRDDAGPDTLAHELTHVAEGKALAGSVQRDKDEEEEPPEESGGLLDMITGLFSGAGAAGSSGDKELAGEGGLGPSGGLHALSAAAGMPDPLSLAAGMRMQGEARAQPEVGMSGSMQSLLDAQGLPAPAGAPGADMTQASSLTAGGLLGEVGTQIAEGVNSLFGGPGPDDPAAAPQADSPSKQLARAMWSTSVVTPAMDALSALKEGKPDVKAAVESLSVADKAFTAVYSANQDEALTESLFTVGNKLTIALEHLKPHAGIKTELSEITQFLQNTSSQLAANKTTIYPADTPETSKPVLEAMWESSTVEPSKEALAELNSDKPDSKRALSLLKRSRTGLLSVLNSTQDAGVRESMTSLLSSLDLLIAMVEPRVGTLATIEAIQDELFGLLPEIAALGDKFK